MYQNESSYVTARAVSLLSEEIRDSSVLYSMQDVKAAIKACVSNTALK